jgi:MATE family multidrug resistance protein
MTIAAAAPPTDVALPPAGSLHELLRVAIPLIISSGSLSLMHVVDRVMLTWYSEEALAASTPGGMLHWTLMSLAFGTVAYVNTFVAQYDGARRADRVAASVWQGVWLATLAGVLLAALTPWTARLTTLFGHAESVRRLEAEYFSVLSLGSLPMLASCALSAFYSGRGRTVVLMIVNAVISLANAVINAMLIFGWGPFPELGIAGAAWGTVCAQTIGCGLYCGWIVMDGESQRYPFRRQCRIDRKLLDRMIRYGSPNGVQYLVDIAAYLMLLVFIGRIGSRELAATNLAFVLNSLAFIPMFGIGTAVSTLVGRRIGEGRPRLAIRTTWLAFGLAAAYTAAWALVYLFASDVILSPFARRSDPAAFAQLRPVVQTLLIYVVLYSFFDAMAVIFGSATRGAGDTRFSLVYTGVVLWSTMVVPIWWIQQRGGGLYACWNVIVFQLIVLGSGFLLRFQQGRWLTMQVIERGPPDPDAAVVIEEPSAAVGIGGYAAEPVFTESMLLPAREEESAGS